MYRGRRQDILRECEFQPEAQAIAQFEMRLVSLRGPSNTLREDAYPNRAERVLATYGGPNGKQAVTEQDFIHQFNDPNDPEDGARDAAGVVSAIQDMLIEKYDYAAAIDARFGSGAEICTGPENFELRQALTL